MQIESRFFACIVILILFFNVSSDKNTTMSIRTFIFCDICNPQGIRSIEFRRAPREGDRNGRRLSDGRSWFEGSLPAAIENNWIADSTGQHICPACNKKKENRKTKCF